PVRDLSIIFRLTQRALSCQSLEEFWPVLSEELLPHFGCDRLSCFFVEDKTLHSRLATGLKEPIRLSLGEGIAGHVAQTTKTYLSHDPYADPLFSPRYDQLTGYRTQNILCAA